MCVCVCVCAVLADWKVLLREKSNKETTRITLSNLWLLRCPPVSISTQTLTAASRNTAAPSQADLAELERKVSAAHQRPRLMNDPSRRCPPRRLCSSAFSSSLDCKGGDGVPGRDAALRQPLQGLARLPGLQVRNHFSCSCPGYSSRPLRTSPCAPASRHFSSDPVSVSVSLLQTGKRRAQSRRSCAGRAITSGSSRRLQCRRRPWCGRATADILAPTACLFAACAHRVAFPAWCWVDSGGRERCSETR